MESVAAVKQGQRTHLDGRHAAFDATTRNNADRHLEQIQILLLRTQSHDLSVG